MLISSILERLVDVDGGFKFLANLILDMMTKNHIQINTTPLHLWRLFSNMLLNQGIISFQTQIPFSFANPQKNNSSVYELFFSES